MESGGEGERDPVIDPVPGFDRRGIDAMGARVEELDPDHTAGGIEIDVEVGPDLLCPIDLRLGLVLEKDVEDVCLRIVCVDGHRPTSPTP